MDRIRLKQSQTGLQLRMYINKDTDSSEILQSIVITADCTNTRICPLIANCIQLELPIFKVFQLFQPIIPFSTLFPSIYIFNFYDHQQHSVIHVCAVGHDRINQARIYHRYPHPKIIIWSKSMPQDEQIAYSPIMNLCNTHDNLPQYLNIFQGNFTRIDSSHF